jgi:hypothetical protein
MGNIDWALTRNLYRIYRNTVSILKMHFSKSFLLLSTERREMKKTSLFEYDAIPLRTRKPDADWFVKKRAR